ncbi:peptide chain release factor 1 [Achromatium sp. WMS3]|nr:peptide chain release factor 1 [Achromatium sp. WMS3]
MTPSIRNKLEQLLERREELMALLADPKLQTDIGRFKAFSQELAQIDPIAACFQNYRTLEQSLHDTNELLNDPELHEIAQNEITHLKQQQEQLEPQLERLLIPPDLNDKSNIYLEIRAGTGGAEAALFAGDLHRMYLRYAELQGWQVEVVSANEAEHGGYKEVISRIIGSNVYARLKFESGAHRVQRIPTTEAQGRIHTSACTVAILPEVKDINNITISKEELRIDTYRSSGAGGQHVNKTDSAVRITHLTSGIVVECQEERSQHKNRAKAMSLLQSRLLAHAREQQASEQANTRRLQVGTGDRSERIRTYNFPQNRLTDHRINLTLYQLDEVMQGQIDGILNSLAREHEMEQLALLAQQVS